MEQNIGRYDKWLNAIYGLKGPKAGEFTFRIINSSHDHYLSVRYKNLGHEDEADELAVWKPIQNSNDVELVASIKTQGIILAANMDHDKIVIVSQRSDCIAASIYTHNGEFVREALA